ncbi:MAG: Xaa-Pro peptidase family protein [Desulfurococcaceae archaeon]
MIQINKLERIAEEKGVDAVVIGSTDNIAYFLDVKVVGDAVLLLYFSRDRVELYTPLLEYYRFRDTLPSDVEVYALSKTIKPIDAKVLDDDFKTIVKKIIENHKKVGIDLSHNSPHTRVFTTLPQDKVVDVSDNIDKTRMIKEDWELDRISRAIDTTGYCIYRLINNLNEDTSETALAGLFEYEARQQGVEELAFTPLTLFKPGNSYPHNLPSSRKIGSNNLILIDVGVKIENRCSDITRMVIYGKLSDEELRIIEVVEEALNTAIHAIEPGVKAKDIDKAARDVLEKHGLSTRFIHGLGHGLGVNVHEPPYIRIGSETVIEPGMVFTIEPGIYFNGKFGVRLEEDIYVSKTKAVVLSKDIERVFTI